MEKRYHIYRKTDGAWDAAGASFVKNELAAKKAAEKLLEKETRVQSTGTRGVQSAIISVDKNEAPPARLDDRQMLEYEVVFRT